MNDPLREAAREWLAKATTDWAAVEILVGHEHCPREVVCFHCQQHVEKLLKGLLTRHAIESPRTHDLKRLVQLAVPHCPALSGFVDRVDMLTDHAVQSRYPDDWREIDEEEMNEMIEFARKLGALLHPKLEA